MHQIWLAALHRQPADEQRGNVSGYYMPPNGSLTLHLKIFELVVAFDPGKAALNGGTGSHKEAPVLHLLAVG